MNEDIKKPDHLYRFPCMCPWTGSRYKSSERRLAIVAESHYLPPWPPGVTPLNHDPKKWYAARQEDVPDENDAHAWMDTDWCVRNRCKSRNRTYQKIGKVLKRHGLSFDDIAFFNYVFRPAEEGKPGYSQGKLFKIFDEDWKVSSEIMEWFIRKHQPKAIVIASTTVMKWTCVRCDLAAHPEIDTCVTDHPRNTNPFSDDVREFLDKLDKSHESPIRCGARADSPFRLNEAQRRRCRSYPWRKKPAS